jgi:hypothetical protein
MEWWPLIRENIGTQPFNMRRRTYYVGDTNVGFPTAQDVLNGAAKLVGLHLNEGPSLLNGHLAAVAMDLEGFELTPLMVVDGDPFPIGLALLLGAENGVLVMHVKCIHDLCTLPLDILSYLHHILVIFMLFDDYWE